MQLQAPWSSDLERLITAPCLRHWVGAASSRTHPCPYLIPTLSWSGLWRAGGGCAWSTSQGGKKKEDMKAEASGEGHRGLEEGWWEEGKSRGQEVQKSREGPRGEAERGEELEVQAGH